MTNQLHNFKLYSGIAVFISLLINFPRLLYNTNIISDFETTLSSSSFYEILFRFLVLSIYVYLILFINTLDATLNSKKNNHNVYFIGLILNLIVYFIYITIYKFSLSHLFELNIGTKDNSIIHLVYFIVLVFMIIISFLLKEQNNYQKSLIEKEKLKQQNLLNELKALQNQVNPHFLFNSFNTLNALIHDNPDATSFVNNLSKMYRYILNSSENNISLVGDEINFTKNYIAILQKRFGDKFNVTFNNIEALSHKRIPTIGLQLTIENAVKHNEVSSENPLLIEVSSYSDTIVITNKIRKRKEPIDSNGTGLFNLNKRYELLFNSRIKISKENNYFKVTLPVF